MILVHGGAWDIPEDRREEARLACATAADAGHALLAAGGDALAAALLAVRSMEDAPCLGAGHGAAPDENGDFSLDAAVMVGADLSCGAVAHVPPMRHPVDLAEAVRAHSRHVLLVGPQAMDFGAEHGLSGCDPAELRTAWNDRTGHDTVGAIALDARGHLAVDTSTGGTPGRHPARVGDTPLVGCGLYADDALGAAASTGIGEAIIRVTLARAQVDAVHAGEAPEDALRVRITAMTARTGAEGGAIVVTPDGRWGVFHTTPAMAWAVRSERWTEGGWRA